MLDTWSILQGYFTTSKAASLCRPQVACATGHESSQQGARINTIVAFAAWPWLKCALPFLAVPIQHNEHFCRQQIK